MTFSNPIIVTVDGMQHQVYPIKNDINGNARYVIHYLALDIDKYNSVSKYGFTKYRGKAFGGGIVFQAVNLQDKVEYMIRKVKAENGC